MPRRQSTCRYGHNDWSIKGDGSRYCRPCRNTRRKAQAQGELRQLPESCQVCGTNNWYIYPNGKRACRKCHAKAVRRRQLQWAYGITDEHYDAMRYTQGNCCAICFTNTKLYVDHDHQTGTIRGLICHRCNVGLGLFGDDPLAIQRAAVYLQERR